MSPSLEDQERHLLVKIVDRILYKLDDLVRPYVHKILVVIEPLLIDEDYYARVEVCVCVCACVCVCVCACVRVCVGGCVWMSLSLSPPGFVYVSLSVSPVRLPLPVC